MAKYPCKSCIYFDVCGDNSRTQECEGRVTKSQKPRCVICGKPFSGFGNNPWPVKDEGRCCDKCNGDYVIPARIVGIYEKGV